MRHPEENASGAIKRSDSRPRNYARPAVGTYGQYPYCETWDGTSSSLTATPHGGAYGGGYGYGYQYGRWPAVRHSWEERPDEPVGVSLSAEAHWQFRQAIQLMRSTGWAHYEFYALLVVKRSDPMTVERIEFPKQWVSGGSCEAPAAAIRQVRDTLSEGEAIAGSVHFHPMSTRTHSGFLSWTDYVLLHQMALEQAPEVLVPVRTSLGSLTVPEGAELRVDHQVIFSCEAPQRISIEPVSNIVFEAHTFCLVNAGEGYYGKVLRTVLCTICGHTQRLLHPAAVTVLPQQVAPSEQEEAQLMRRLRDCLQTTPAWPKKTSRLTVQEKASLQTQASRRQELTRRATALAAELEQVLDELRRLDSDPQ